MSAVLSSLATFSCNPFRRPISRVTNKIVSLWMVYAGVLPYCDVRHGGRPVRLYLLGLENAETYFDHDVWADFGGATCCAPRQKNSSRKRWARLDR